MATSFTANLGLGEPAFNDVNWDVVLNPNFTTLDSVLAASLTVSITTTDVTLTQTQANNMRLKLTGVLTGNRNLKLPATGGKWIIDNQTTGAFTVTVLTTAGGSTGVVVPQSTIRMVFSDGTNIAFADAQPIGTNAVANTMLAQMPANTVKANLTGGTANAGDSTMVALIAALVAAGIGVVPTGSLQEYAATSAPTGWLECDGSAVSRTTYSALYAVIGITFGSGDGSTTFNLPDMRGKFARGWDHGAGVDPARTFGSAQADAFQNFTGTIGGLQTQLAFSSPGTGVFATTTVGGGNASGSSAVYNVTIDASRQARTSTETRPKNVALLYMIKT